MTSGIYKITNLLNGKCYIGSASDLSKRKWEHFNKEKNPHLQNAMRKYGIENFAWEIILECQKDKLIYWEQYYIDKEDFSNLYNIRTKANSNFGLVSSQETRDKLSKINKGRKPSALCIQKLIERNKKPISDETRIKMRLAKLGKMSGENNPFFGKTHTEETRNKIKDALAKKGDAHRVKHHTEETKKKISESRLGEKHWLYGKHHSEETKKKMSNSHKLRLDTLKSIDPFDAERIKQFNKEK